MASNFTDIEKEAAVSWQEWPIYVVMRMKKLKAIQEKLRVQGDTASQRIRREELLKAVYDLGDQSAGTPSQAAAAAEPAAAAPAASAAPAPAAAEEDYYDYAASAPAEPAESKKADDGDDDYYEDVSY